MISPKKLILLTFSALGLIIVAKSDRTLSLEKDEKELVRSLTSINKLAIKSFQTEHGDILDCIDINKQLAFDHPLLKNHTIQFAVAEYRHQVFGAKVYQWLNQNHSRLYTYWTADGFIKTGCYNILCPGFVQVSARIPLGIFFGPVSVYDGPQYEVGIRIYKDGSTGDWWLVVYDENVGYWPNSLFTKAGLGHGASLVAYGGEVYSPVNEKSPSMGSGHFPSEGYSKAAYVNNFEVVEGSVASKPLFPVTLFSSTPNCYKASLTVIRAMVSFDKLQMLTFSVLILIIVAESHRKVLVEDNGRELERLLNYVNRPAIKSFQTELGDILDCIDINKQLAFDHPMLRTHSVQLRPTNTSKWAINRNNSKNGGSVPFGQDGIRCPLGTVVVKRTTYEDVIQAHRLKSMGSKYSRYVSSKGNNIDLTGYHFAVGEFKYDNYGGKANLSIWEPEVSPTQISSASMLVATGNYEHFQSIRAGWIVYQWLNKNHSRLFTYWTADGFIKTGCFNTLCPGFVQVQISSCICNNALSKQDSKTGDWWLVVFDENVGYWPKSLFTEDGLVHGASLISYGGEVYSPVKEKSPHMGSGHFPIEGYLRAAYVNGIEVADEIDGKLSKPPISTVNPLSTTPNCYKAETKSDSKVPYDAIFYGGPGGCTL
ncbi:hypothetical protein YC2023_008850 [Brassica napus]